MGQIHRHSSGWPLNLTDFTLRPRVAHVRDQFSLRPTLWRHREQLRDLPPRFDCRGRNWPEDPGACVIEHLRKHDVVPESGETVVEMPHVSPTVVRRAGFFVVVVLGPVVWVVASRC